MPSPSTPSSLLDRPALISLTAGYLDALARHAPDSVPLAPDVQTVENLRAIRPGEGLWCTATGGRGTFALFVPDPVRQEAGFLGVIGQESEPVLLGLRLKVAHGQITEAEHLIARSLPVRSLKNLCKPRSCLRAEIPPGSRLPEPGLRAAGAAFYDALLAGDGAAALFAGGCVWQANGIVIAGPGMPPWFRGSAFPAVARGCAGQIDSKVFRYISAIDHRRVFAADPVTGLVMGLSQFRHPMDDVPYPVRLADGSTMMFAPEFAPFDMPAAHVWKVGPDRRIHAIEAMDFRAPLNSPSGWQPEARQRQRLALPSQPSRGKARI